LHCFTGPCKIFMQLQDWCIINRPAACFASFTAKAHAVWENVENVVCRYASGDHRLRILPKKWGFLLTLLLILEGKCRLMRSLCLCVCVQLLNQLSNFYGIWYESYAIGGNSELVGPPFIFQHSTWLTTTCDMFALTLCTLCGDTSPKLRSICLDFVEASASTWYLAVLIVLWPREVCQCQKSEFCSDVICTRTILLTALAWKGILHAHYNTLEGISKQQLKNWSQLTVIVWFCLF
jgi:hypothetical protein